MSLAAPSANDLTPPSSPEFVTNLEGPNLLAKRQYDAIILRLAASPIHDMLEAVGTLSKRFPNEVDLGNGQAYKFPHESLTGTLEDAQEDYTKVLQYFLKVTQRLRIPYTLVLAKFHKRNNTVSLYLQFYYAILVNLVSDRHLHGVPPRDRECNDYVPVRKRQALGDPARHASRLQGGPDQHGRGKGEKS